MRYKHFTNANVDVSALAVGTWGMGELERFGYVKDETGRATTAGITRARNDSIEAIQAALQNGVNLIDTAPVYGNGYSEMLVGDAIRDFDRDKILISTKFSLVPGAQKPAGRPGGGGSFKNIMREVAQSLSLLKTDYIDFYFLHYPDPGTDIAETYSALNVLKKRGLIRYIGVSNHSQEQIEAALEWADIDVIQPPYSMVSRNEEDLMKWAKSKGIDSMTYGSLGSGLLTGAIRTKPEFQPGDIRGGFYQKLYQQENFDKFLKLLELMDKIAADHNVSVAQVAINYSTQMDFVGTALCGMANAKEAIENCKTFDWELSAEELAALQTCLDENEIGKFKLLGF
ncbi:MAG: aldo/keto reductase [Lachnospiraceae bacterium]|nr:aldo/keto reductase [Lachnospiraceae bacterium]